MSNTIDIIVPDLGDFADVEVIEVLVEVGASVEREDGLLTIETDKASMDIPASDAGVLASLTVGVGDTISSGDTIGTMTVVSTAADAAEAEGSEVPVVEVASTATPAAAAEPQALGEQTLVVPALGDFDSVEVIEVHIAPGDTIALEDALVTMETDKAAMDVPAEMAGTVESVLVKVGDSVSEGSPLAVINAVQSASVEEPQPAKVAPETPKVTPTPVPAKAPPPRQLPSINEAGFSKAHASPSVRKLARELGVDLTQVAGTGIKKRIIHDDVKAFVKAILSGQQSLSSGPSLPKTPSIDFAKFGEIDIQPLTRIQKISGPRLQASWINIPHVTQHDHADITDMEARRQTLKGAAKERGISLTPLAFIMKACVAALNEFPKVNSSLSDDGESLVYKKYCHLGFAADTPNGLVVPVIRDADRKDVYELAAELGELSALAREGKLKAAQMQGACFTVSSLGGIGGTAFTPIVNAPEVAILGVSRSTMQPVWDGSAFNPRLMLPLSLSYDHRVIDGAMAVRFTTYLGQILTDADRLLEAQP